MVCSLIRLLCAWRRRGLAGLAGLACLLSLSVNAQTLESALSPGPLIKGHAESQDQCARCHVRFDRAGQDRLCLDCHKPVAQDIRAGTGYHGRIKISSCRSCHTDHKGPGQQIAAFKQADFDHRQTDWPLRAAHAGPACVQCHAAGKPWRAAPQDCQACHRKDDKHKGSLGAQCADCHTELNWKDAKFDHATTRFVLKGKHVDVQCAACHPGAKYRGVPDTCNGCHVKDDKHRGRYGGQCETCHNARSWKAVDFNHDTETRYALRGKHRLARCDSCHTGPLYKDKLASDCQACHRKDDKHKSSLGADCSACHVESDWKETARFDHDRSRFPLLGKHGVAECKSCHGPGPAGVLVYRETPKACVACHRKDDRHLSTLGDACAGCHGERSWKIGRFDHAVTRFPLAGGHASPKVSCASCHRDLKSYRSTPQACIGCHAKEDKHQGQLGRDCQSCHTDQRWTGVRFDHNRARFALNGAHAKVGCSACHATLRYLDAPTACLACHRQNDRHQGRLGEGCESCHNARHWSLVQFDHDRQTPYPLTGQHRRASCVACHGTPAPAGRATAPLGNNCLSCHRKDDPHDGAFGPRCELCHSTSDWKTLSPRRPAPAQVGAGRPPTAASGGLP